MDSFFLRFLYKSLYGTKYIFNERRIIMSNELIKRINDVKSEIERLENELQELEKEMYIFIHWSCIHMMTCSGIISKYLMRLYLKRKQRE